jgi:hypothetical protein
MSARTRSKAAHGEDDFAAGVVWTVGADGGKEKDCVVGAVAVCVNGCVAGDPDAPGDPGAPGPMAMESTSSDASAPAPFPKMLAGGPCQSAP